VSERGDLANWSTGAEGAIPAVGGAMDLAIGAKQVIVLTDLFTKDGTPKVVAQCTYPLTGTACVSRVFTDFAVFDVTSAGLAVTDTYAGATFAWLVERTGLELIDATTGGDHA
jgi:3-oxoadipate CoA-transferase beta subunit